MKKVLGIVPSSKDITLGAVEGDTSAQNHVPLEKDTYKFAPADDQSKSLTNLYEFITTTISEKGITDIEILKAGTSHKGKGPSPERIKAEAAIQLAASNANIRVNLIPHKTLETARKQEQQMEEKTIDEQLGHSFPSEAKREAAFIALLKTKKGN